MADDDNRTIIQLAKDCSSSIVGFDALSEHDAGSILSDNTNALSAAFDFDSLLMATKAYQVAHRSHLRLLAHSERARKQGSVNLYNSVPLLETELRNAQGSRNANLSPANGSDSIHSNKLDDTQDSVASRDTRTLHHKRTQSPVGPLQSRPPGWNALLTRVGKSRARNSRRIADQMETTTSNITTDANRTNLQEHIESVEPSRIKWRRNVGDSIKNHSHFQSSLQKP